jgi:hypothetical protein
VILPCPCWGKTGLRVERVAREAPELLPKIAAGDGTSSRVAMC